MKCAMCGSEAAGVYTYVLPNDDEETEPLCRACSGRYRSLNYVDIERVDGAAE